MAEVQTLTNLVSNLSRAEFTGAPTAEKVGMYKPHNGV